MAPFQTIFATSRQPLHSSSFAFRHRHRHRYRLAVPSRASCSNFLQVRPQVSLLRTNATPTPSSKRSKRGFRGVDEEEEEEEDGNGVVWRKVKQVVLWGMEGVYILWLFLLPYAPHIIGFLADIGGSCVGYKFGHHQLSTGSFSEFLLCFATNKRGVVGIHVIEAPVIHPMSEGLFNFVIGWTLMFAPLLYTDSKNNRYKGSLDLLWGFQMFLTNTFLIPYMAIRLNQADGKDSPRKPSQLGSTMIQGAHIVGLIGGAVCLISILWGIIGRSEGDFGSLSQRWDFLMSYLGSERLAYAFIWDIVLYMIFQPWLIGDNLSNVGENRVTIVNYLRFVPVIGLVVYLLCLNRDKEMYMVNKSLND